MAGNRSTLVAIAFSGLESLMSDNFDQNANTGF